MRSLRKTAIAATAALCALASPLVAQVQSHRDIKTPALRQFQMPQPKRIELPNGLVIFLQEDRELPLIRGSVTIRGGGRDVPAEKAGLTGVLGQAWRTGGTATRTGDQLDEQLESRAAIVETSADADSMSVRLNVLKQDLDFAFPIWVDLIRNPAFRQEKIDLAKTQLNTAISRRNDEPMQIALREAAKLAYGANSPYTRQAEYSTVASITRQDLLDFHKRFVHPNNMIIGFVGDFDSAKLEKQLRDTFGSLPRGPQAPKPDQSMNPSKPGVYFISKQDVNQSNIVLTHPGTIRNVPEYYSLLVMNEILSGGFSGRLMNDLRTARGLAYGVSGGVGAEWDRPGLFRLWIGTKSGSTMEAIEALRGHVNDLVTKGFTADELAAAKEVILNTFVFTMDSRAKVMQQAMTLEFYGYPPDWYGQYVSGVQRVTSDDVANAAKKYVHPDRMSILVVGNEKEFDKPLTNLGGVTNVDITIPEPGAAPGAAAGSAGAAPAVAPATASTQEGLALARKVVDFAGGKAKLDALQSVRMSATVNTKTPQGDMELEVESTLRYPDTQRSVMKTPMGEMTRVTSPGAAFVQSPMGMQDLPSSQREASMAELKAETFNVLKNVDNPKYVFTLGGTETINGVQARALIVNADGAPMTWYVDPATGKPLRKVAISRGPQGGESVSTYGEWQSYGGVMVPTSITVTRGGEQIASQKVKSVEVNPTLDPKLFEKPAAPTPQP